MFGHLMYFMSALEQITTNLIGISNHGYMWCSVQFCLINYNQTDIG